MTREELNRAALLLSWCEDDKIPEMFSEYLDCDSCPIKQWCTPCKEEDTVERYECQEVVEDYINNGLIGV